MIAVVQYGRNRIIQTTLVHTVFRGKRTLALVEESRCHWRGKLFSAKDQANDTTFLKKNYTCGLSAISNSVYTNFVGVA
jgi:hypothetical protein